MIKNLFRFKNLFYLSINDINRLDQIHRNNIFLFFLFLKLFLIFAFIPEIHAKWFLPFMEQSFASHSLNPWESHLINNGNILSFPYGITMYLGYMPLTFIGWLIQNNYDINLHFTNIGFALNSLLFDYLTLLAILTISRKYSQNLLLISYWCNPVVIFITYWHGQLDVLPILLLLWGLCLLRWKKPTYSGILIGLAISSKFSMILSLFFIYIFLFRNRWNTNFLRPFLISSTLTLLICFIPFLYSNAFYDMVIRTPETGRIFEVAINYGDKIRFYLFPTSYLLISYLIWRIKKITFDLFLISIGLGFFSLLIFLPPSPGWYLWVIPFISFYQINSKNDDLYTPYIFYLFYLFYNLKFTTGAEFIWIDNFDFGLINQSKIQFDFSQSILFTFLQISAILVFIKMYLYGIKRNNYYLRGGYPLLLGIFGLSSELNNKLANSIQNIFGNERINFINERDYYLWGNNNEMWNKKSFLDFDSNNLGKLAKDVLNLSKGNSIISNFNKDKFSTNFSNQNIKSKDLVLIVGLHSLNIKRLRKRIELKVFIDIDDNLIMANDNSLEDFNIITRPKNNYKNNDLRDLDNRKKYILNFSNHADLVFKISPVNVNLNNQNLDRKFKPRLKLSVILENGLYHNELTGNLISLCGNQVDVEQKDYDSVKLTIEGDITKEDIEAVAFRLIPNIEDLLGYNCSWQDGVNGLMQLITLIHLSNLMNEGNY